MEGRRSGGPFYSPIALTECSGDGTLCASSARLAGSREENVKKPKGPARPKPSQARRRELERKRQLAEQQAEEQLWREIQESPPKYVLDVANLPDTYMWDGKASLEIMNRIRAWLKKNYEIGGVMAVTGSRGGWLTSADSPLLRTAPCIYVCKRKE